MENQEVLELLREIRNGIRYLVAREGFSGYGVPEEGAPPFADQKAAHTAALDDIMTGKRPPL